MNALTITSSKRFDLFEKTILSLSTHLLDKDFIDIIIHYDDSSCDNDRLRMKQLLATCFGTKIIHHVFLNKNDIKSNKRHMEIMKMWKANNELMNIDYVFHTEDDFIYTKDFCLNEAANLLKSNPDVALVGFSQQIRKVPEKYQPIKLFNKIYWEWIYDKTSPLLSGLFMDETIMEKNNIPGYWCLYINWPHFGFRPGLHDIDKLKKLETFTDKMDSFELEFAIRYSELYKTYCHVDEICSHIGTEISSYQLNNSSR